jgi:hypothetical protein
MMFVVFCNCVVLGVVEGCIFIVFAICFYLFVLEASSFVDDFFYRMG